jgi:hypothetical protein
MEGEMLQPSSLLSLTPADRLVDRADRPYFLWDEEMTLDRFVELLASEDRQVRAYLVGKLMRQAKPDDVFQFVTLEQIRQLWDELARYLGDRRAFWRWLLDRWERTRG